MRFLMSDTVYWNQVPSIQSGTPILMQFYFVRKPFTEIFKIIFWSHSILPLSKTKTSTLSLWDVALIYSIDQDWVANFPHHHQDICLKFWSVVPDQWHQSYWDISEKYKHPIFVPDLLNKTVWKCSPDMPV